MVASDAQYADDIAAVPGFWLQALERVGPVFETFPPNELDRKILAFLTDVAVHDFEYTPSATMSDTSTHRPIVSFTISFKFAPNPYLQVSVLSKRVRYHAASAYPTVIEKSVRCP